MKKLFPQMTENPGASAVVSCVSYWFFAFLLIPGMFSLSMGDTQWEDYTFWIEMAYHMINFIFMLFFCFPYLKDNFLLVELDAKGILGTAVGCGTAIIVVKQLIWMLSLASGNELFANAAYGTRLTTEMDLMYFPGALIQEMPLWGTLFMVVLAPVTITCIFYVCIFAPICTRNPLLAYLATAALLLLPRLSMVFCLWTMSQQMVVYLLQLPVHLIACWSYQKTDCVWTPIFAYAFANGLASLMMILGMY